MMVRVIMEMKHPGCSVENETGVTVATLVVDPGKYKATLHAREDAVLKGTKVGEGILREIRQMWQPLYHLDLQVSKDPKRAITLDEFKRGCRSCI